MPQDPQHEDDAAAAVYREAFAKTRRTPPPPLDRARLSDLSRGPRGESVRAHVGTMLILAATLAVMSWYLYGYLTLDSYLARLGGRLMIGSLIGRILLEGYSLLLLLRIDFADASSKFIQASHAFLNCRQHAHKSLKWLALAGYAAGYYLLLYVFREVPSTATWVLLAVSFPLIMGAVYFLGIRPSERQEREALVELEGLMGEE